MCLVYLYRWRINWSMIWIAIFIQLLISWARDRFSILLVRSLSKKVLFPFLLFSIYFSIIFLIFLMTFVFVLLASDRCWSCNDEIRRIRRQEASCCCCRNPDLWSCLLSVLERDSMSLRESTVLETELCWIQW